MASRLPARVLRRLRAPSTHEESFIDTEPERIRIASIPSAHPYVHAISDPRRVSVLPDPPVPGAPAGRWWPPVAMTADWLATHAGDFDVLHVHFGLESFSVEELRAALETARRVGRPVVHTVHDLENPQLIEQGHHRALLDVIVPAADHIVTLTAEAAVEIARRWGRRSTVIAHPTLLTALPPAPELRDDAVRVGLHLRDLRPNVDAERAIRSAAGAADLLAADGRLLRIEALLNEHVRDEETAARVVAGAENSPAVRVRRTPRLTDAGIEKWLRGLDLFVLPYRHGTHSGWVELCYDLGVRVAGTDVGHIGAQHPTEFSVIDLDDPHTLADVVRSISTADRGERAALLDERRRERLEERRSVRDAHTALYASARASVQSRVSA